MDVFTRLFGDLLVFVYHCFDRIVINGYLSNLSRPEQVVYFFRQVLGIPIVGKEVLSKRTEEYKPGGKRVPASTESLWRARRKAAARKIPSCLRCAGGRTQRPL